MQPLRLQQVAERFGVTGNTILAWVRDAGFPPPVPLGPPPSRIKVFIVDEIDAWLASCAAARAGVKPPPKASGRVAFWEAVKRGERPHPRTVARLRREAAERREAAT